jgi:polyhydroxyalkanoate synthesis regulator phasin
VSQPIDVERELAELRARVRRTPAPASNQDLTALQKAIANLNANWYIAATLPPPAPNAPFTWRVVYFAKRIVRRVMVELLNTIVQQQNAFNLQVARALTELAAQESRVDALEKRIAELERARAGEGK